MVLALSFSLPPPPPSPPLSLSSLLSPLFALTLTPSIQPFLSICCPVYSLFCVLFLLLIKQERKLFRKRELYLPTIEAPKKRSRFLVPETFLSQKQMKLDLSQRSRTKESRPSRASCSLQRMHLYSQWGLADVENCGKPPGCAQQNFFSSGSFCFSFPLPIFRGRKTSERSCARSVAQPQANARNTLRAAHRPILIVPMCVTYVEGQNERSSQSKYTDYRMPVVFIKHSAP